MLNGPVQRLFQFGIYIGTAPFIWPQRQHRIIDMSQTYIENPTHSTPWNHNCHIESLKCFYNVVVAMCIRNWKLMTRRYWKWKRMHWYEIADLWCVDARPETVCVLIVKISSIADQQKPPSLPEARQIPFKKLISPTKCQGLECHLMTMRGKQHPNSSHLEPIFDDNFS